MGGHCVPMQPVTDQSQMPPFLQTSADRYHLEPHPEHLCGACPYAHPPMPIGRTPKPGGLSQIRYPPPHGQEHRPTSQTQAFRLGESMPPPSPQLAHSRPGQTHAKGKKSPERALSCILCPLGTDCAACHPRGRTSQLRAAQGSRMGQVHWAGQGHRRALSGQPGQEFDLFQTSHVTGHKSSLHSLPLLSFPSRFPFFLFSSPFFSFTYSVSSSF